MRSIGYGATNHGEEMEIRVGLIQQDVDYNITLLTSSERAELRGLARGILEERAPPELLKEMDLINEELRPLLQLRYEGIGTPFSERKIEDLSDRINAKKWKVVDAIGGREDLTRKMLTLTYGIQRSNQLGRNALPIFD